MWYNEDIPILKLTKGGIFITANNLILPSLTNTLMSRLKFVVFTMKIKGVTDIGE